MKIISILFFVFILFAIVSLIVWAISNMLNKSSDRSEKSIVQASSKSTPLDDKKKVKTQKNIPLSNIDESLTEKPSQDEFLDERTSIRLQQIDI